MCVCVCSAPPQEPSPPPVGPQLPTGHTSQFIPPGMCLGPAPGPPTPSPILPRDRTSLDKVLLDTHTHTLTISHTHAHTHTLTISHTHAHTHTHRWWSIWWVMGPTIGTLSSARPATPTTAWLWEMSSNTSLSDVPTATPSIPPGETNPLSLGKLRPLATLLAIQLMLLPRRQ